MGQVRPKLVDAGNPGLSLGGAGWTVVETGFGVELFAMVQQSEKGRRKGVPTFPGAAGR